MRQPTKISRRMVLALAAAVMGTVPSVRGDIVPTGDVSPANPSTWTTSTTGYIGNTDVGQVNVNAGSDLLSNTTYLGNATGSTGTVIVDGSGSTWSCTNSSLYLGYSGTGSLTITNGGSVSNSYGFLGYNASSSGMATIDGTGSTWTNSSSLYVGLSGTGTLNITNGAMVNVGSVAEGSTATGTINFGSNGGTLVTSSLYASPDQFTGTGTINAYGLLSDGNLVLDATHGLNQTLAWVSANQNVTVQLDLRGRLSGGSLTMGDLGVGYIGNGTLTIRDGVAVTSRYGYLGYKSGSSGTVTVDGTGSMWTSTNLYVGSSGTGSLSITNGGQVSSYYGGYLGYDTGATGTVAVDGTGSMWTSRSLYVGSSGTGALNITNGGQVSSYSVGYLGYNTGATGTVTVNGTGSTWTSSSLYVGNNGAGALNITNSGIVTVAGTTYVAFYSTATGSINFGSNGGTLTTQSLYAGRAQFTGTGTINTRGMVINGNLVFDVTQGVNQTLTWIGANQNVTIHLDLTGGSGAVGDLGAGYTGTGTLTIRDGVAVTSGNGYLGYMTGATGTAMVTGTGSTWTNSSYLYVGHSGTGILNITHGGKVSINSGMLGNNTGATGTVTVDGTGSTWTNSSSLYVGNYGTGTLTITNGGKVGDSNGYLGYYSGATGTATIDGTDSRWTNSQDVFIGYNGTGAMSITHGGNVSDRVDYLGYYAGTTGTVTVDGTGSMWTNIRLYVGNSGTGTLNITHDGQVSSYGGYLGYNAGATGTVTVDGTGSTWTNSSYLYVGYSGTGTLNITHGGIVTVAGATYVAFYSTATGSINFGSNGGTLTTQSLHAGRAQFTGTGTINTRGIIHDGDLVFDATQGLNQTLNWIGTNQNVTIHLDLTGGSGAVGDLGAGYFGSGSLTIRNGVTVTSVYGYLGYKSGSSGMATVDGTGSTWNISHDLIAGMSGTGALNITRGGKVSTYLGWLGYSAGATGLVTVDGTGSTWANYSDFYVGNSGTGTLTISNGGKVSNFNGYLAYYTGATGTVMMDGTGSIWTSTNLYVGNSGTGTLTITNGGKVGDSNGYLGYDTGATGTATIDGTGSMWTNSLCVFIGYNGTGAMSITNGGNVSDRVGDLGYNAGATGTATVDGTGSTWTSSSICVGVNGTGTLNITNGAMVNVGSTCVVAEGSTATGTINFGSNGGTLVTSSLYASPDQFTGTGTINAYGLLSDGNLVLDATHGLNQTLAWVSANQNVTVQLDLRGRLSGGSLTMGDLGVGYIGNGTLTIRDGVAVTSRYGYLGYKSGSSGTVTVDGTGSTWTNSYLYVGLSGTGALNITNGGKINSSCDCILGSDTGATGTVTVNGTGSTWTTTNYSYLYVGLSGMGTLNITNGGKVSSKNYSYLGFSSNATGTVTVDGNGSTWAINYGLYAGSSGTGTLTITNGGQVSSNSVGYLGYNTGAKGTVTVDGSGSTWTNSSGLYVGNSGTGALNITHGGKVSSNWSNIGYNTDATGTVTVDGTDSSWTNSNSLYVGNSGAGTLRITNGGQVTTTNVSINNLSSVAMNIGDGSLLSLGTGTLTNAGTIRLKALPNATSGIYTPILAATWSGTGTVQALGGSWNAATHTFLITNASTGTAGQAVSFDLAQTQRVRITDPLAGTAAAGFLPAPSASTMTFTAATLTTAQAALCAGTLTTGSSLLTGWNFTTAGYTPGNPVFLSLQVGSGHAPNNLALWHFDGTTWTPYAAPDLSYDGTYASFTVTGFSGYAVATIPGIWQNTSSANNNWSGYNNWSTGTPPAKIDALFNANAAYAVAFDADQTCHNLHVAAGNVTLALGSHTLTASGTVTIAPASVLQISGTNVGLGTSVIANAGELRFLPTGNAVVANPITGPGTLTQSGPGTTTLSHYAGTGNINVNTGRLAFAPTTIANTMTVVTPSLTISGTTSAWTSTLDLGNNALVIKVPTTGGGDAAQTQAQTVANQIMSGLNGTNLWQGTGITSSTAANYFNTTGNPLYAVGWIQNNTLGLTVGDGTSNTTAADGAEPLYPDYGPFASDNPSIGLNDILVKYTYWGDADLNGIIDDTDVALLVNGYQLGLSGWVNGDFDYNGVVDDTDVAILINAYQFQSGPLTGGFLVLSGDGSVGGGATAAVPEVGTVGVLGLGVMGLLRRRRRGRGG